MARDLDSSELTALRAALAQGGRLAALALYRQQTSAPLSEARAFIEGLEVQMPEADAPSSGLPQAVESWRITATPQPDAAAPPPDLGDISALPEVRAELLDLDKLGAITVLRARGLRVEQAVAAVNAWLALHARSTEPLPQDLLQGILSILAGTSRRAELLRQYRMSAERWTEEQRFAAFSIVERLVELTCTLCDQLRDGGITDTELRRRMREEAPSFSEAMHGEAYNYAMFVTR